MARDYSTYWDDPEFMARQDAERDHAFENAMRVEPEDPIAVYTRAYDLARRDLKVTEHRAARESHMPDIGIGGLFARYAPDWSGIRVPRKLGTTRRNILARSARLRGVATGVLGLSLRALILSTAAIGIAVSGYAGIRWNDITKAIAIAEQQMDCARVTAIEDADGRIFAHVPVIDGATCAARRAELAMSFDDVDHIPERPGLTVPFDPKIESSVVPAVVTIEGEIAPFPKTVFGHDWRGFLRYGAAEIGLLDGNRGLSGPMLSTFEALTGHPESLSRWDKPVMIIAASVFAARHLPDEASRAGFISDYMMAVRGRGYPLGGRLAADALFGHDPETLSERCLFGRAMGTPVVLPLDAAVVGTSAGRAWGSVLGPAARRCVTELAASQEEANLALAELESLCGNDEICARPSLEPDLDARNLRLAAIARANLPIAPPQTQASIEARQVILDGLRLSGDWIPGETLVSTIDWRAQSELDSTLPAALADLQRNLPEGLCFTTGCRNQAIHSVTAIEVHPEGPVVRAAHDSRHGQFFGPVKNGADGYVSVAPDWGLGSTRKMLLALIAARHDYKELCSLSSGDAACTGGAWIPVEKALAKSKNDPFAWLAEQHMDEVYQLLDAIGAAPSARPATGFDIAYDTVRHAPPAAYNTLLSALLLDGSSPSVRIGATAPAKLDLTSLGYDVTTIARALDILAAPTTRPEGTLYATAQAAALPGCTALGGKSGTHEVASIDIVKTSTLLWRCDLGRTKRTYITTAVISSGDSEITLGNRKHVELAPLHRAALSAATSRGVTPRTSK
ncbi:hypothetical protein [Aliiruegeria sabulilitoris]|uniref:hypothetical protein n=1 Tax=Aliiruegeria sabulilitoris TaxID=1510458 RepID=UPI000830B2B6|nr:hypothetical protein [Aliiruegeria sabulilitoris]NDR55377.1 hypothetical protein [Pseudoruegeria sp. M32A2M]